VVGRNCRFLQGKDSDPAVVGDLRAATTPATAHPCVVELINYRKDGSKFWNQARCVGCSAASMTLHLVLEDTAVILAQQVISIGHTVLHAPCGSS